MDSKLTRRRFLAAAAGGAVLFELPSGLALAQFGRGPAQPVFTPAEPLNSPLGTPFGVKPGRVAWAHDPQATTWDGATNAPGWWDDANTHPAAVEAMLRKAVQAVGAAATPKEAWARILADFNKRQGRGETGYTPGEKIAVKLNLNQSRSHGDGANASYITPQLVLALTRQLVHDVGAAPADITYYDAVRAVPSTLFDRVTREFPGVRFADSTGTDGRERALPDPAAALTLSRTGTRLYLPSCVSQAAYLINIAGLKGHSLAGVTLCAKNHLGSLLTAAGDSGAAAMHATITVKSGRGGGAQRAGDYNGLVDLGGHRHLGGKTVLFLIDALYATQHNEFRLTPACKWASAPFGGHWTSSLFAAQDGVAIDSVAVDFLRSEPTIASIVTGPVDNYLHEAALAAAAPSKTVYDPERDGKPLASQGVHEHWNNAADKKYSRNLGTGQGIELLSV